MVGGLPYCITQCISRSSLYLPGVVGDERLSVTIQMTSARSINSGSGGPFVVLEFPSAVDPAIVYLETDTDGLYLEEPDQVARYRTLMKHLVMTALRPGETVTRLQQMIE